MASKFYMPTLSLLGENALNDGVEEINSLGFKKCLIVTDRNLVDVGLVDNLTELLIEIGVEFFIYDQVQPNPTTKNVADGIELFTEHNCEFTISFGGGSPHDCAKAICLVLANGGVINDYEGVNVSTKPQVPLVAINTTAGTASEMTVFTIITDEERHIKMAIVDEHVLPIIAINDPSLMHAMPKSLTAATGMDALTHAIEAYVSTAATPVTDACARKAIEIIVDSLETAVFEPNNDIARENMAYAQYLAGMAFSNASLGYVHAMAHQLGGFYDLPHGVCNAILLPYVQQFNSQVVSDKLADVASFMGIDVSGLSIDEQAQAAIDYIITLAERIDIPKGLRDIGVKVEDFDVLATNALQDACGLTNPIQATKEEIIEIFTKAY